MVKREAKQGTGGGAEKGGQDSAPFSVLTQAGRQDMS